MIDQLEFDIRAACCANIAQNRRDRDTTRFAFVAPAMARVLIDEPVALDDEAACRVVLAQFFAADDIKRLLNVALVEARAMLTTVRGTVQ